MFTQKLKKIIIMVIIAYSCQMYLQAENVFNNGTSAATLPSRETVSIKGDIANMFLDRVYGFYNGAFLSVNMVPSYSDGQFKLSFFHLPVSILEDIDEKEAFARINKELETVWAVPTAQQYKEALDTLEERMQSSIDTLIAEDKKEWSLAQSRKLMDVLRQVDQLSDGEFVQLLLQLLIENSQYVSASQLYPTVSFYQKEDAVALEQSVKAYVPLIKDILQNGVCVITPTALLAGIELLKSMNLDVSIWRAALPAINSMLPEMTFLFNDQAYMEASEKIASLIIIKISKGVLALNLGTTIEQYHAKRHQEVDYMVLQKIVEAGINCDTLKQGAITLPLDENTTCYVNLDQDPFTGNDVLKIECVVSI